MERARFRLDGWDVGILVLGMVIGTGVGLALGYGSRSGAGGLAVSLAGMTLRRRLAPANSELIYAESPPPVTWTLLPMLVVGIGGLVSALGVMALLVIGAGVADASDRGLPGEYLLPPIGGCLVGAAMVIAGIRWARRGSARELSAKATASGGRRPKKSKRRKSAV